jgi:hypothetical protein
MDKLAMHLALHGTLVLTISLFGGLYLYRAILEENNEHGWHLLHAGGTARGVMLLALAAVIHLPALPLWQLTAAVWLVIFFVWTSVLAMVITAVSGNRGFGWSGARANKLTYGLYVLGTVAVFPALALLITGLLDAL